MSDDLSNVVKIILDDKELSDNLFSLIGAMMELSKSRSEAVDRMLKNIYGIKEGNSNDKNT